MPCFSLMVRCVPYFDSDLTFYKFLSMSDALPFLNIYLNPACHILSYFITIYCCLPLFIWALWPAVGLTRDPGGVQTLGAGTPGRKWNNLSRQEAWFVNLISFDTMIPWSKQHQTTTAIGFHLSHNWVAIKHFNAAQAPIPSAKVTSKKVTSTKIPTAQVQKAFESWSEKNRHKMKQDEARWNKMKRDETRWNT